MSVISFKVETRDADPVLVIDGQPVPDDHTITLTAKAMAACARDFMLAGADSGSKAGVKAGMEAMAQARSTRRRVERDAAGLIVAIVEEPVVTKP